MTNDDCTFTPSRALCICCLFMAAIFAYTSVSKLLTDVEWCLWMPLHAAAALVCCVHAFRVTRASRGAAYGLLAGGAAVFLKEAAGCTENWRLDWRELVSVDMQKRGVREKIGSTLVWLAMGLQLDASGGLFETKRALLIVTSSTAVCTAYLLHKP